MNFLVSSTRPLSLRAWFLRPSIESYKAASLAASPVADMPQPYSRPTCYTSCSSLRSIEESAAISAPMPLLFTLEIVLFAILGDFRFLSPLGPSSPSPIISLPSPLSDSDGPLEAI